MEELSFVSSKDVVVSLALTEEAVHIGISYEKHKNWLMPLKVS